MPSSGDAVSAIPALGSGLGYRFELRDEIFESRDEIDFLEIIADQFTDTHDRMRELESVCEVFTVVPHGVGLSVGSATTPDGDYLRSIKRVSDFTRSPYYSEHLCVTRAPGIDIGHLSPLWYTEHVLQKTIDNVSRVQDYLAKPLVLENISYLFDIPSASMSQVEFFNRLVEATGCGVLLDVTNVYINSVNHQFDPAEFIRQMPLDSVVQVHLAGGFWEGHVLVDGHSEPVHEESWNLLEMLTELTTIKASILEHDANFPSQISVLLEQVDRARGIIAAPCKRVPAGVG